MEDKNEFHELLFRVLFFDFFFFKKIFIFLFLKNQTEDEMYDFDF